MTQSELFACLEQHRTDLFRVRTRFAACDQYPEITPGQPFWPPQYALLHMSWHQCHCDLYRPFITDYPELGPHAVLNGMSEPDRKIMRDKCFDHAEQIVRILSDFLTRKKEQHLLEHDAAICAYHAARLILLRAEDTPQNRNSPEHIAINKAQLCLNVITQYFSFSAQLRNMVCLIFLPYSNLHSPSPAPVPRQRHRAAQIPLATLAQDRIRTKPRPRRLQHIPRRPEPPAPRHPQSSPPIRFRGR